MANLIDQAIGSVFAGRPNISQQVEDQRLANLGRQSVANLNQANADIVNERLNTNRQTKEIFNQFQGGDQQELIDQMYRVNPDVAVALQERAQKLDDKKRERMLADAEYYSRLAVMSNTPELWAKNFGDTPFEHRNALIAGSKEAIDLYQKDQNKKGKFDNFLTEGGKVVPGIELQDGTVIDPKTRQPLYGVTRAPKTNVQVQEDRTTPTSANLTKAQDKFKSLQNQAIEVRNLASTIGKQGYDVAGMMAVGKELLSGLPFTDKIIDLEDTVKTRTLMRTIRANTVRVLSDEKGNMSENDRKYVYELFPNMGIFENPTTATTKLIALAEFIERKAAIEAGTLQAKPLADMSVQEIMNEFNDKKISRMTAFTALKAYHPERFEKQGQ